METPFSKKEIFLIHFGGFFIQFKVHSLKWFQTIQIAWSELAIYKVNFILVALMPLFVFFVIKFSLWTSIYGGDLERNIGGYTLYQMLSYHLWGLVVSVISMSYHSENIAEDIRLGKISSYLIYPFSLWEFHAAKFIARLVLQVLIACFTVLFIGFVMRDYWGSFVFQNFLMGVLLSVYAAIFWFTIHFLLGILAFWLDETWTVFVIFQIITQFFSGAIIPLELFPQWISNILSYTPFPYLVFLPIKIFSGASIPLVSVFVHLSFWITAVSFSGFLFWRIGIRNYTAAGM